MSGQSAIEWTDATWNPVTGCDRVSPGCAHCYALTLAARLKKMGQPGYQRDGDPRTSGPGFGVTLHPHKLAEPLRWRKPRMVFVNSMSDLFHDEVPDEFIAHVWTTMARAEQHTFQVLTKRPERARELVPQLALRNGTWLSNVWLGVSIENSRYTWRADVLREIPAAVRFISAEPLLGSLYPKGDARVAVQTQARRLRAERAGAAADAATAEAEGREGVRGAAPLDLTGIDWVIVGGESGLGARPMHPDWAREIRDACLARLEIRGGALDGLPIDSVTVDFGGGLRTIRRPALFFKQWGGRTPKANGRLLDGREWNEMPA